MIVDLRLYPAMKDSGVAWLGEVPAHWEVRRLRNVAEMRVSNVDKITKDDERTVRLCNYMDVYKGDRIRAEMPFMKATATTDEIERFRLQVGDVLITKDSESWNDIGVPSLVSESASDLISGYHLALLRPREQDLSGDYLFHAIQSKSVAYQFHVEAKGVTRFGLTHSGIKSVWLPFPPLTEQAAIVHFLDHAERRIRRYIRAKEKLIALLEEQKQAIIHQAVTGRIDVRTGQPYPAYKPSGVEWLGDVPEHWEVLPLCAVGRPKSVADQQNRELLSVYLHRGIIRFSEVQKKRTNVTSEDLSKYQAVDPGDLVLNNQQAWRGSVGVSNLTGIVSPAYLVLALNSGLNVPFANALFRDRVMVVQYLLCSRGVGSIQRNLYWPHLKRAMFALPPPGEQRAIARSLQQVTAKSGEGVARVHSEIELLHEYRTRLIADVVTGKLDVREAAAALPEVDPLADDDEADDPFDAGAAAAFGDDQEVAEVVG